MQRQLLTDLIAWKNADNRLPLMLDGARQVGKSYLIEKLFGEHHFENVFKINFEDSPNAIALFKSSIKADDLIERISIFLGKDFNAKTDLLFFDEIGLCEEALNSLKYFKEQRPDIYLCASGSNIGLIKRYPVGQAYELTLYPMSFFEFVMAANNQPLIKAFKEKQRNTVVHDQLTILFRQYLFVGGMPAANAHWHNSHSPIVKKSQEIRKIQNDLIKGYIRDFGKYDEKNKLLATQLEAIFRNIPKQLSQTIDTHVKRFKFSHIIKGKDRYKDFQTVIDYLANTHLLSKSPIIEGRPSMPLSTQASAGKFKLFCHDVGILHALLEIPYQKIVQQSFPYKGYVAENFAQNELLVNGITTTYSWRNTRSAELEFLISNAIGDIIPIEIKSGKNTKAKSLNLYIQQYSPTKAYKLCDLIGGGRETNTHTRPLYYTCHAATSLLLEWDTDNYF